MSVKKLWELFYTFAKVGAMTFGGGMAMLPILEREIVENKHWATNEELTDYFAIGQCTPGVIAVNTATFIGQKHAGIVGGIVATIGVVFPSLIIITIIAAFLKNFADNVYVGYAFSGIRVCVCVLILNAVIKLFRGAVKDAAGVIIFALVLGFSVFTDISPIIFVVAAAAAGIIFKRGGEK